MPLKSDFLAMHRLHWQYPTRAYGYAEDAVRLKKAGKIKQAETAEKRAQAWLGRATRLEPSGLKFAPFRGRSKF